MCNVYEVYIIRQEGPSLKWKHVLGQKYPAAKYLLKVNNKNKNDFIRHSSSVYLGKVSA